MRGLNVKKKAFKEPHGSIREEAIAWGEQRIRSGGSRLPGWSGPLNQAAAVGFERLATIKMRR